MSWTETMSPEEMQRLVARKTLLCKVCVHSLLFRKKIRRTENQVDVGAGVGNKKRFRHYYDTLKGPEFDALKTQEGQVREWMAAVALSSNLERSWHLIALQTLPLVRIKLEEFIAERTQLVQELRGHYTQRMLEAKPELGPHWDANDYPLASQLQAAFRIEVGYRSTLDVPANVEEISQEFLNELREAQVQSCPNILEMAEMGLINTFSHLTTHLAARLGATEAGKSHKLYDTAVDKLVEFLSVCKAMNVRDRPDINALADKALAVMNGVKMDDLRKKSNADLKETIRVGIGEVARALDPLVAKGKTRKFDLDG